jgi:hypothetical protein
MIASRCSRLRKECVFPVPIVRKRRSGKRTYVSKNSAAIHTWKAFWITSSCRRVAEMEAKIDGLVTLLKSRQAPSLNDELLGFTPDPGPTKIPYAPPTPSPTDGPYPPVPPNQLGDLERRPVLVPAIIQDGLDSIRLANANPHPASASRPLFGFSPTADQAEVLLDRFRQMTPCFPFVYLPPSMSAKELVRDRPFLYHCIVAVTCESPRRQIAFGDEMMQYLGDRMLVKGEKSLDLLLGILTYTGWFVLLLVVLFFIGHSQLCKRH